MIRTQTGWSVDLISTDMYISWCFYLSFRVMGLDDCLTIRFSS